MQHIAFRMSGKNEMGSVRPGRVWPAWIWFAGAILGWVRVAPAHELFTAYVQHQVHLSVGARHIDLTLDLTFFEQWSARERQVMDANRNGSISRSELEAYLRQLAPTLAQQVKLRAAGRELELVPLYEPEADLLGQDQIGPGHHRLRLCFFAATPPTLRANEDLIVEDGLWPEAKMLGTPQAEGRDGCDLEATISISTGLVPSPPDHARRFSFRCARPPDRANEARRPASHPLSIAVEPPKPSPLPESTQTQTVP